EDEGVPGHEVLGVSAGGEDRHGALGHGVGEGAGHEDGAAGMELLVARRMAGEIDWYFRTGIRRRLVEEDILQTEAPLAAAAGAGGRGRVSSVSSNVLRLLRTHIQPPETCLKVSV